MINLRLVRAMRALCLSQALLSLRRKLAEWKLLTSFIAGIFYRQRSCGGAAMRARYPRCSFIGAEKGHYRFRPFITCNSLSPTRLRLRSNAGSVDIARLLWNRFQP